MQLRNPLVRFLFKAFPFSSFLLEQRTPREKKVLTTVTCVFLISKSIFGPKDEFKNVFPPVSQYAVSPGVPPSEVQGLSVIGTGIISNLKERTRLASELRKSQRLSEIGSGRSQRLSEVGSMFILTPRTEFSNL